MWYDLCIYMVGAFLAIFESFKSNSWKFFERSPKLSLWVSGISLGASTFGAFCAVWRLNYGTGGEGLWVAIIAFAMLCIINFCILMRKRTVLKRRQRQRERMRFGAESSYEECLEFGNVTGLKILLEKNDPGTEINESLIDELMKYRKSTISIIVEQLKQVRIKTSLTSTKACEAAREEILPMLLATHCIDELMQNTGENEYTGEEEIIRDLRSHVIAHLATLAVAISDNDELQNIAFEIKLSHWELPCKAITTQKHPFSALDFNTMMLKVDVKAVQYQCRRCYLFWSGKWWECRTTTCRCCGMFATVTNFFFSFRSWTLPVLNQPPAPAEPAYELQSV